MAEIYRGGILSIGKGQHEAAAALSLGRLHGFIDVVAPQALRVVVPSLASFAIGLMKDSAVASTIGVAELSERANQQAQVNFAVLPIFAMAAAFYIAASLPIAWLSRSVDARMRARVDR
jgi:polar amino acid transport system permease protein